MFIQVTIFAAAIIAVSAQNHIQGQATSSQSTLRHGIAQNNYGFQTLAAPISYTTPTFQSIPTSYLRPAIPIPITNNAFYTTPLASTSAITYATPVTVHAPLHNPSISHHALSHHVPLHTAAITHAAPITRLIHANPTQYYGPIRQHIAPLTHHTAPVTLQYAPGHYNHYQHTSGHQDSYAYPKYQFEYSVHDTHTGDIKSQQEERDGDNVNGVYSLHEADGSVRTVHYNSHGDNGFKAEVHHSQPSTHIQPTSHYAPKYNH